MTRLEEEILVFLVVMVLALIVTFVCGHYFDTDISESAARVLLFYVMYRLGFNVGYQRKTNDRYHEGFSDGIKFSNQMIELFTLEIGKKELYKGFLEYVLKKFNVDKEGKA